MDRDARVRRARLSRVSAAPRPEWPARRSPAWTKIEATFTTRHTCIDDPPGGGPCYYSVRAVDTLADGSLREGDDERRGPSSATANTARHAPTNLTTCVGGTLDCNRPRWRACAHRRDRDRLGSAERHRRDHRLLPHLPRRRRLFEPARGFFPTAARSPGSSTRPTRARTTTASRRSTTSASRRRARASRGPGA